MAEAAGETAETIDVPLRKSRVTVGDTIQAVISEDIVRETVEDAVTRAVVSTGNDVVRNGKLNQVRSSDKALFVV